ncbi:transcription factor MYB119-like [Olea europaea var. sylvestris]|uniref:transcription factor MYB119-like n=1 Tax=Olea europaea var. sylvestris TaxID=158386 RepID=UPI000C1D6C70|nr:transcription factor MYB119-like [Olea europaea var. sylvestris]
MEIGGNCFMYGNLRDNSSFFQQKPPLTATDKFSSSQNNFYYQETLNSVQNQLPFFSPNLFSGFSANKLPETSFGNETLPYAEVAWNQDEHVNENSNEVKLTSESSDSREKREKVQPDGYLIKGQWTEEEDRKLIELVMQYGPRNWTMIAEKMVLRAGKQCRERWLNHLRPNIKKDDWSEEEERLLIEVHKRVGNKWAEIAKYIAGRTENSINNHWNATKRRKIKRTKIKKPRGENGKRQSTLLQDYIQNNYMDNCSGFTSTSTTSYAAATTITPPSSTVPEVEGQPFFTFETCEEEMDFMKNLFGNNDSSNNASMVDKGKAMMYPPAASEMKMQINEDAFLYPHFLDSAIGLTLDLPMNQDPSLEGRMEGDLMGMVSSCQFSHPKLINNSNTM